MHRKQINYFLPNRFVFAKGGVADEKREVASETADKAKAPFRDNEVKYDYSDPRKMSPWRAQVKKLLEDSVDSKYHTFIPEVLKQIDETKLVTEVLPKTEKIALKDGILVFIEKKTGKQLEISVDIRADLTAELNEMHNSNRRNMIRSYPAERRFAYIGIAGRYVDDTDREKRRMEREKESGGGGTHSRGPAKTKETKEEAAENKRMRASLEAAKADRADILNQMREASDQGRGFNIRADVSPSIRSMGKDSFERNWAFMDHGDEIDDLFNQDANSAEGYQINPFKQLNWKREDLRKLIQGQIEIRTPLGNNIKLDDLRNNNDRLYFSEVTGKIYGDRYTEFKKELADRGIPEVVLNLLNKDQGLLEHLPGAKTILRKNNEPDDLLKTYERLKKISDELSAIDEKNIPAKYKEIYPHLDKLNTVLQVLGDYVIYARKLVNLVDQLRLDVGKRTASAESTVLSFERDAKGKISDTRENKIKGALDDLFIQDCATPYEYTSELSAIFHKITPYALEKNFRNDVTFQDLTGNMQTVGGEWSTRYLSPEAAFIAAYKQISVQKQNPTTGEWTTEVTEETAVEHINELVSIGLGAYNSIPGERPMRELMEDLHRAGAEVSTGMPLRFTGNITDDTRNLLHVLEIKNLSDINKKDNKLEKRVAALRAKFVRMGSVIWQRNNMERGRRESEAREKESSKAVVVKFSPEQADDIITQLKATNKFDPEKLTKIRSTLIGGIAVMAPKPGAAFFIPFELGNGFTLTISGSLSIDNANAGVGVSKAFQPTDDISVTISAGAALNAGYFLTYSKDTGVTPHGWVGASAGVGAGITKKFSKVDVSVNGGVGALLGYGTMGLVASPAVTAGMGFDWAKSQEKFESALKKSEVEHHIAELDKAGDLWNEIKQNRSKYPEFSEMLYRIENIQTLDESSKKDMLKASYEMFKEGLRTEALDDTTKNWYERLLPTGAGFGVAFAGVPPMPIPYVYAEFQLWSRHIVYRVAADVEESQKIGEEEARAAILKAYAKPGTTVAEKKLSASGELVWNPEKNRLSLKSVNSAGMDFKDFNAQFNNFRDTLAGKAKIFVEPAELEDGKNGGLLRLKPQEAYGITRVYVDPALRDNVVVTYTGADLFLSVKNDQEIFVRREDINYPFKEKGFLSESTIIITADPKLTTAKVKADSGWYMRQVPGREWQRKERYAGETPEKREEKLKQSNIKTWEEYGDWWGTDGKADRLEFNKEMEGFKESYDSWMQEIAIKQDDFASAELRPEIVAKIEALGKDDSFIRKFRDLTTEGFNVIQQGARPTMSDGKPNMPELMKLFRDRIAPNMNVTETNAAFYHFLMASFMDLRKTEGDAKVQERYTYYLNAFHKPLIKSVFDTYYKDELHDAEWEKKSNAAVDYIMEQLKDPAIILKEAKSSVQPGSIFGTLVGMPGTQGRLTGIRSFYNYTEEKDPKWGFIPASKENLEFTSKNETEREVARFWLNKHSPLKPNLDKKELPDCATKKEEYQKYQAEVMDALYSPLVLKLAQVIAVEFTPAEMNKLKEVYEKGSVVETDEVVLTKENMDAVKKLLMWAGKVREAQNAGKTSLELKKPFKLMLETAVLNGIYKKCGNPTGILVEKFSRVAVIKTQLSGGAGMGETYVNVMSADNRLDINGIAGVAATFPAPKIVLPKSPKLPKLCPPGRGKKDTPRDEGDTPRDDTPPTSTDDSPGPENPSPPEGTPPTAQESHPTPAPGPGVEGGSGNTEVATDQGNVGDANSNRI